MLGSEKGIEMSASMFKLSLGRSIGHRMLVVLGVVLALALAGTGIGIWEIGRAHV